MIDLYNSIISGNEVKASLLELKNKLKTLDKEGTLKDTLLGCSFNATERFMKLLQNEDPKIRQNAALCLGYLDFQGSADAIFDAYVNDETLYNKAPYLRALRRLNISGFIPALEKRREQLISEQAPGSNDKHVIEEMHELHSILGVSSDHHFTGLNLLNEAVLTTNRDHKDLTAAKLTAIPHKEFPAGIMVKTKNIARVMNIRTFEEILFIPEGITSCPADPHRAANDVISKGLAGYICERHDNPSSPIRFRTEVRHPDPEIRSSFERKFSKDLELLSRWKLVNSVSDYEVELRFVYSPEGTFRLLIDFCLLKDTRFKYRRETISAGMKPYLAATIAELAKNYYIDNATVLDPFCGVGTLLVERDAVRPARLLYGIDLFGEAVAKAGINIKAAGISSKTELINKNFFEFHHSHRFNEIITDFPFGTDRKTEADLDSIYRLFFTRIPNLLEKQNLLVLYTRNRDLLLKYSQKLHYMILAEHEISKKENAYLYILRYDND